MNSCESKPVGALTRTISTPLWSVSMQYAPMLLHLFQTILIPPFFLPLSLALSGHRKGNILWSPFTVTMENSMKKNTPNLILCTERKPLRMRQPWRTLLVTHQVHCNYQSRGAMDMFWSEINVFGVL
jgi:hypothetical protein